MKKGTVCFLTRNDEVLLVLIEYSPNDRKWTGIGGYVKEGESLEDTIIRESHEESFIEIDRDSLRKVAIVKDHALELNVFLADKWSGELRAKEPSLKEFRWFRNDQLPFSEMHNDNDKWLPQVLEGRLMLKENGQYREVEELN